jgi:hypothetical protein
MRERAPRSVGRPERGRCLQEGQTGRSAEEIAEARSSQITRRWWEVARFGEILQPRHEATHIRRVHVPGLLSGLFRPRSAAFADLRGHYRSRVLATRVSCGARGSTLTNRRSGMAKTRPCIRLCESVTGSSLLTV